MNRHWFWLGLAIAGAHGQASGGGTPLTTQRVAFGLSAPVFVTHAPNDYRRLFVIEQRLGIRIIKDGVLLSASFLYIPNLLSTGSEQGLLGLAFHPDFENNRQFYINYTNTSGDTVVAMYRASIANPDLAETSGDIILSVGQPYSNHNGGWMGFGPDGYLYIALGDGGDQLDPDGNGQSTSGELLGNILRINVDGDDFPADEQRDYAIPPDNPFANGDGEDEIWAYGLRNPWRCAFDRQTGDFWIADVGQGSWEEINVQPASSPGGENYGWDCREGSECTDFGGCNCGSLNSVLPIHEYSHALGCSITGGEVYRGCGIPDLQGTYFFADYCSWRIWSLTYDGLNASVVDRTEELSPPSPLAISSISSFGADAAGEIYICDRGGEIYKIVAAGGAAQMVDSDPDEGIIDARTPLAPDGITTLGIREFTLYFDRPANCTAPWAFAVEQEGGIQAAPQITGVQAVAGNGLKATLSRPLEPKSWTTVIHHPTQSMVRVGYLPGDVSGDGVTSPIDILELVDSLNGVTASPPLWSGDLDRSGIVAPADIIMLVDLLNGVGNLDAYNGARLP